MTLGDLAFLSRREFLQVSTASVLASASLTPTLATAAPATGTSAAQYIALRLQQHGADILFGVPGATCDPFFAAAARTPKMSVVVTSSDLEAGYAADGFARLRGLSALSVTYGVGTMSLLSVIGGAYAERSPIVVVNGGPSKLDLRLQREHQTLFSHSVGREKSDLTMFREITSYAQRAESREDVPRVVDEAVSAALRERRPVYIEIPKDLWDIHVGSSEVVPAPSGEATGFNIARLQDAKRPLLLLGVELQRYGCAASAAALVKKLGVPYVTDMLGKAVIAETTPSFAGVYIGANSVPAVRELVDKSDLVLCLGSIFGRQYRELAMRKDVVAVTGASLAPTLDALLKQPFTPRAEHAQRNPLNGRRFADRRKSVPTRPGFGYDAAMGAISDALDDTFVVVTDTSLSMYPAADLDVKGPFVCNSVWQAIGFSVGAAVGVALATGKRPLVICGDGGFQMTAQALSTMARAKLRSIVIVLDNGLYGIEQFLLDPSYFSGGAAPRGYVGLNRWNYADLAKAMGVTHTATVASTAELKQALETARHGEGPVLISVTLPPRDLPGQLLKEPS